eukprot:3768401-Amphidinium_carterae.2
MKGSHMDSGITVRSGARIHFDMAQLNLKRPEERKFTTATQIKICRQSFRIRQGTNEDNLLGSDQDDGRRATKGDDDDACKVVRW